MYIFNNAFHCWPSKKVQCWPNINFSSAIIQKSIWNKMEGIRKRRMKKNSFEAEWTSHLYELPRFHWSFYVFKWFSRSVRNHMKVLTSSQTKCFRFWYLIDECPILRSMNFVSILPIWIKESVDTVFFGTIMLEFTSGVIVVMIPIPRIVLSPLSIHTL